MKQARSEGNKAASLIKANKAEFYVCDVDLEDNPEDVISAVEVIIKTLGKQRSAFMLISAGIKNIIVYVHVPTELEEKISGIAWLDNSVSSIRSVNSSNEKYKDLLMYVIEPDNGIHTPFKLKDVVRSNAFSYLREIGCIKVESDEEFIGFDD